MVHENLKVNISLYLKTRPLHHRSYLLLRLGLGAALAPLLE
jgi:hypothetical protein